MQVLCVILKMRRVAANPLGQANILPRYSTHCEPYLLDENECPGVAGSMYISCDPFVEADDVENPPVLKETKWGERGNHSKDALTIAKGQGRDCRKV
jgi:hypothetical protein